ncbi:GNAT family N-acetyltransferase [Pseudomonas bohemica]|uniref:GNAT family N-acetyltransferase n=1 Tax=Pseudomonas bohemica TaxID=2044872 RepID=UPI000DA63712|nr:GNAT family N-acetyltransferase [Pseudomonas bohemica]
MTATSSESDHLSIRAAQVEDAAQLARIHLQTWQATYVDLLSERYLCGLSAGVERRAIALGEAIASRKMSILVVEQGGQLVAWASFGSSRDADALASTGELRAINLLPRVWSQGIGRQLWQEVRQQLIAAGFTQATVWVIQGNQRALGFYEAVGFVQQPDTAVTVVENDEPLPLVRYRVAL